MQARCSYGIACSMWCNHYDLPCLSFSHLCYNQIHNSPALHVLKHYTRAQMAQKVGHETDD